MPVNQLASGKPSTAPMVIKFTQLSAQISNEGVYNTGPYGPSHSVPAYCFSAHSCVAVTPAALPTPPTSPCPQSSPCLPVHLEALPREAHVPACPQAHVPACHR